MKGLKNWNVVYAVVIGFLLILMLVFKLITNHFQ